MGNSRSYSRKTLENRPKIASRGSSIPCVFVCMLLKVVSHYYLSVLSMLVMFPKTFGWGGWWGKLYPVFCGDFFNFAKPLRPQYKTAVNKPLVSLCFLLSNGLGDCSLRLPKLPVFGVVALGSIFVMKNLRKSAIK